MIKINKPEDIPDNTPNELPSIINRRFDELGSEFQPFGWKPVTLCCRWNLPVSAPLFPIPSTTAFTAMTSSISHALRSKVQDVFGINEVLNSQKYKFF